MRTGRVVVAVVMVTATLAISAAAAALSFLAVTDLATFVGWPQHTAWLIFPVIELFFLAGTAETAMRLRETRSAAYPKILIGAALLVSLALNVTDHIVRATPATGWQLGLVGLLAALVPAAQLAALHLLLERLRQFGEPPQPALSTVAEPFTSRVIQRGAVLNEDGLSDRDQTPDRTPNASDDADEQADGPSPIADDTHERLAVVRGIVKDLQVQGRHPSRDLVARQLRSGGVRIGTTELSELLRTVREAQTE